jgi:hypothetical protein
MQATGGDSNIDFNIGAKGTGHVTILGNDNPGAIQFNCENNSHGQQIKAAAHSIGSSAVVTIPDVTGDMIVGKIGGTNFADSLLIGHATHGTLSTAIRNTGVGLGALDALTSGDKNTGLGRNAGSAINTGSRNTLMGQAAGQALTTASENTIVGDSAMTTNTSSGAYNSGLGVGTLAAVDSGDYNLALGWQSGDALTSGKGNVIIGANADVSSNTGDRQLKIAGYDGSTTTTWISGDSNGVVTLADDLIIKDGGTIGSASDTDAITIAANGVVTFSQAPVFPDGVVPLADLDIDGGTDIGADLTTSDLIIVDDGAGGTNRKAALSRVVTLVSANIDDPTALAIALG